MYIHASQCERPGRSYVTSYVCKLFKIEEEFEEHDDGKKKFISSHLFDLFSKNISTKENELGARVITDLHRSTVSAPLHSNSSTVTSAPVHHSPVTDTDSDYVVKSVTFSLLQWLSVTLGHCPFSNAVQDSNANE